MNAWNQTRKNEHYKNALLSRMKETQAELEALTESFEIPVGRPTVEKKLNNLKNHLAFMKKELRAVKEDEEKNAGLGGNSGAGY